MKLLFKNFKPTPTPSTPCPPTMLLPCHLPLLLTLHAPGPGVASSQCTAVLSGTHPPATYHFPASSPQKLLEQLILSGQSTVELRGGQAGRGLAPPYGASVVGPLGKGARPWGCPWARQ